MGHEGAGLAAALRAARPADPVGVGVRRVGHVVVDDVADLRHVDPARRDVRGDQHVELPLAEALHGLLPGALTHVPLQGHGAVPHGVEVARQAPRSVLRPQEHDRAHEVGLGQQVPQQRRLLALLHGVEGVVDGLGRRRVGQLDRVGLVEQRVGEAADLARHGGREEQVLATRRELGQDPLDVGQEAHVEHVVRLVEDQDLDAVELGVPLAHQVEQATGAGHDDLGPSAQPLDLGVLVHAPEDRDRAHARVLGEGLELAVDLDGELARGREDQGARVPAAPLPQAMQDREREGGRLARARLGEAEDVAAVDDLADGLGLDGARLLVARLLHGPEDVGVEPEGGEAALRTLARIRLRHGWTGVRPLRAGSGS